MATILTPRTATTVRRHAFATLATAVLLLATELALAAAGKVLFVSGSVQVERGATRALAAGDAIEVGDVIVTGPASRAQLLMADGAKVALRAGTRFRIDAMTLPASVTAPGQARATTAEGSSAATLLKGGFRTVTGSVGKSNPAGYQVRTPVGVLGIRGTDYALTWCDKDCPPGTADGLYLGVYPGGGGIIFRPASGAPFNLDPGQFAFLPTGSTTPQPLQAPPPPLGDDAAGPVAVGSLGGGALPGDGGPAGGLDDFGNRRSPAGEPEPEEPGPDGGTGGGSGGTTASLAQPVGGSDANGNPVDLTGGSATPEVPAGREQNLAYSVGNIGSFGIFANAVDQGTALATSGGNVTAFAAEVAINDIPTPGTIGIGTSSNTDTGSNAGTGLRWGRWNGGAAQVTTASGGGPIPLATQSLHWIYEAPRDVPGVLPVTGTASYVLVGGTSPTDTSGNVGTLGAASLGVDFTSQNLEFAVRLTIDQAEWFVSGTGSLDGGGPRFSGFGENGSIGGNGFAAGLINGLLVPGSAAAPAAPAAAFSYTLVDLQDNRGPVSGVAGFVAGSGAPVGPPAPARRDVAFAVGGLGQEPAFTSVASNTPAEYGQGPGFNLVRFTAGFPTGSTPVQAEYGIGSSTVAESNYDSVTLLRWGRWSGGVASVATGGGPPGPVDLLSSSLHWIVSANAPDAPVLPASGTASYSLVGGTSPTDSLGNTGTVGSATFNANFTNQSVDSALALTVGDRIINATGTGTIGAQLGLAPHQFGGTYDVTGTNTGTGQGFDGGGRFDGFFSAPGNPTTPGVPGGAGLTYSLQDFTDGTTVQGTAIFRAP
ncbi:MAG: FecR domain-containing protein [Chromatiales bacterium]|nr:FecR domain-containing protein [Chromatiales bacterium]